MRHDVLRDRSLHSSEFPIPARCFFFFFFIELNRDQSATWKVVGCIVSFGGELRSSPCVAELGAVWNQVFEATDGALWSESGWLSARKCRRRGEVPLCMLAWVGEKKQNERLENSPDMWLVSCVVWIKKTRERWKKGAVFKVRIRFRFLKCVFSTWWTFSAASNVNLRPLRLVTFQTWLGKAVAHAMDSFPLEQQPPDWPVYVGPPGGNVQMSTRTELNGQTLNKEVMISTIQRINITVTETELQFVIIFFHFGDANLWSCADCTKSFRRRLHEDR